MNGKKLLILAAFGALATLAMPSAFAATVTNTVTVKWNTQAINVLNVFSNYDAAGAQKLTAPAIVTNTNTGAGSCTATGSGSEVLQTVNFGNVTPDAAAKYTDCLYENGANAFVETTDALGYSLAVASAALPASGAASPYKLCLLPNPAAGWTAPSAGGGVAVAQTVRTTNASVPGVGNGASTCTNVESSKGIDLPTGGSIQTTTGAGGTTSGANYGGDVLLAIPALATSGAQTVVVTYTLTLN